MTQHEATHRVNITVLKGLIKDYGINRSLGNVLDNEESILKAVKKDENH